MTRLGTYNAVCLYIHRCLSTKGLSTESRNVLKTLLPIAVHPFKILTDIKETRKGIFAKMRPPRVMSEFIAAGYQPRGRYITGLYHRGRDSKQMAESP